MSKLRRLRPTVPASPPRYNAPEGQRAAWWRENQAKLSRPALAEILGLTGQTIWRYEAMKEVPIGYKLACAALHAKIEFDWTAAKAKVGASTITF